MTEERELSESGTKALSVHRLSRATVQRYTAYAVVGVLLARVRLTGEVDSFSFAWICALFAVGSGAFPALLGAILGSLTAFFESGSNIADVLTDIAQLTAGFALLYSVGKAAGKRKGKLFGAAGLIYYALAESALVLFTEQTVYNYVVVFLNTISATAAFFLFYYIAKRKSAARSFSEQNLTVLFFAILAAGLGNPTVMNISLSAAVISAAVMFTGNIRGSGSAALFGIAAGILFGMNGGTLEYIAVFSVLGAVSGMLKSIGRILSGSIAFLLLLGLYVLQGKGIEELHYIAEILLGLALFIVIPAEKAGSAFDYLTGIGYDMASGRSFAGRVRLICEKKMDNITAGAEQLRKTVETCLCDTEKCREADFSLLESRLADNICIHCAVQDNCAFVHDGRGKHHPDCRVAQLLGEIRLVSNTWKSKMTMYRTVPQSTLACIEDSIKSVRKSIDATANVDILMTGKVQNECAKASRLVTDAAVYYGEFGIEIMVELKTAAVSEDEQNNIIRACEDAVCDDLELSSSENGVITLVRKAKYTLETGISLACLDADGICGDTCKVMPFGNSGFITAVADGCGTGYGALKESNKAIELIEAMTQSACTYEKAVSLINLLLGLQTEGDRYSTADICIFNKYNGNTKFIKMGAVSSFLIHHNKVAAVGCGASPLGTADDAESCVRNYKLRTGDIIVMMTDGVFDSARGYNNPDEFFIDMFKSVEFGNAKQASEEILNNAVKNVRKARDDMLVYVARVKKAV